jgi:two-component system, cell cycle response regulator DivK
MRKSTLKRAPGHKPLILLVDDFQDNREMYSEYLIFAGFDVAEAQSGAEALEQAVKMLPDLIVMDLALPGMDGWEATRRLKADERTRKIPVVALTGNALQAHIRRAKEAGCDGFLAKPCLPAALADEIRVMLQRSNPPPVPR